MLVSSRLRPTAQHIMHRSKPCGSAQYSANTSKYQNLHRTEAILCVRFAIAHRFALDPRALARHNVEYVGRPGGHCGEPAPDPIPNSAVKTPSAYDTASQDAGKSVAARSSNILLNTQKRTHTTPKPIAPVPHKHTSANAGWSSPVARQAHNLKVAGSNPAPATTFIEMCGNRL